MLVKDVMSSNIYTVTPANSAYDAARLMNQHNVGAIPVVEGENLHGILTDRDIVVRCVAAGKEPHNCNVKDVMTGGAACVMPNQSISDAIRIMSSEQVRRLPVVEHGKLAGIVSLADIARIRSSAETANALTEISMPN